MLISFSFYLGWVLATCASISKYVIFLFNFPFVWGSKVLTAGLEASSEVFVEVSEPVELRNSLYAFTQEKHDQDEVFWSLYFLSAETLVAKLLHRGLELSICQQTWNLNDSEWE